MTVLNKKIVDTLEQPLFLGEGLSLQRYDKNRYAIFLDLYTKQREFNWNPEEINLTKDRADYKDLTPSEEFIFTSNLKFQTMMDSVIARGIPNVMQYVSCPELEACMIEWQRFETLHSFSYTYLIKNVYAEPSKVMDAVLEDPEILKRADSVCKSYDALEKKFRDEGNLRKQIYLTLVDINVLEGLRFYVSFACALAFEQNAKMCGNAKIIDLIKRDEAVHISITQNIIKILRNEIGEGFQDIIAECEEDAIKLFINAAQEEKEWASYLFKDGGLIGLNQNILHLYIEWLTDIRLNNLGLPKQFGTKNPISWLNMDSKKRQVAPQEQEQTSYKISASVNDVDEMNFDFMED